MEELLQAIKCRNCSGAAYSDMAREGFYCPYCNTLAPWGEEGKKMAHEIIYRHVPVGVDPYDGSFKPDLKYRGAALVKNKFDRIEANARIPCTAWRVAAYDPESFAAWSGAKTVSFICPDCSAEVFGKSTQNIFECKNCGNKQAKPSSLNGGEYAKELIVGAECAYLAAYAIPFKVSREQAKRAITDIVSAYSEEFAGKDIVEDIDQVRALYLPFRLCNANMVAQVTTEKGSLLVFHGRLNWALPQSLYHDRYLTNALQPWDFAELCPFRPTLLEGEVQLVGYSRLESVEERARMLMSDMPPLIKKEFGVERARLDWVQHGIQNHEYSQMMLPIWFLDRKPIGRHDARFAVNGQTGKVCGIIDAGDKQERIIEFPGYQLPYLSLDSTHFMTCAPVLGVAGGYSYKPVEFEEAIFKKPDILSRFHLA